MVQNITTLRLCNHPSAIEKPYPAASLDVLIRYDECGVLYRITFDAIHFYFERGKISEDHRKDLLKYIKSEYPKLQKDDSPAPTPVLVDKKLINSIISRTHKSN